MDDGTSGAVTDALLDLTTQPGQDLGEPEIPVDEGAAGLGDLFGSGSDTSTDDTPAADDGAPIESIDLDAFDL